MRLTPESRGGQRKLGGTRPSRRASPASARAARANWKVVADSIAGHSSQGVSTEFRLLDRRTPWPSRVPNSVTPPAYVGRHGHLQPGPATGDRAARPRRRRGRRPVPGRSRRRPRGRAGGGVGPAGRSPRSLAAGASGSGSASTRSRASTVARPTTSPTRTRSRGASPTSGARWPTRPSSWPSTGGASRCRPTWSTTPSPASPTATAGAGAFLAGLPEADRAQLRSEATDLVTKFQECFPPLKPGWRPVSESRAHVELLGGAVVLSGKVDLTLGKLDPGRANKVIIDLKSGMPVAGHREDLRFYALLETLRLGVPPRMLATYYLDAARAQPEAVTVPLLEAALLPHGGRRPQAGRAGRRARPRGAAGVAVPLVPHRRRLRRGSGVAVGPRRPRRARAVTQPSARRPADARRHRRRPVAWGAHGRGHPPAPAVALGACPHARPAASPRSPTRRCRRASAGRRRPAPSRAGSSTRSTARGSG